jgi:hypothetical protein
MTIVELLDGEGLPRLTPLYALPRDKQIRFAGLMARNSTTVANGSAPLVLGSLVARRCPVSVGSA